MGRYVRSGRKSGPTQTIFKSVRLPVKVGHCTIFYQNISKLQSVKFNKREQNVQTGTYISGLCGCCLHAHKLNCFAFDLSFYY